MMFIVAGANGDDAAFQTAGGFSPLQAGVLVAAIAIPSIPAALLAAFCTGLALFR